MSTTRPHGNDNSHSAIQIDPPQQQQQQPVVHSTTAATFLLPTHRPNYNDDDNDNDEDSGEDGPLLNDRTGGSNSGRQRRERRGVESTPFLYRLHDGLSDLSAKLKSYWSASQSYKAPLTGWLKVLRWVLIFLGIALVLGLLGLTGWLLYEFTYVCKADERHSVQLQYSFNPEHYKNFFFHLDQDTVGEISVSQYNPLYDADSSDEVQIYVTARGSSGDITRAVTLGTIANPENSSLEANIYLSMHEFERERVLRKGCVDIDVRIVFPSNMTNYEFLKVHNRNKGGVNISLGQVSHGTNSYSAVNSFNNNNGERARLSLDRLDVKTNDGPVSFADAVVKEELKAVSAQGSIFGKVTVDKRAEMESKGQTFVTVYSDSSDLDLKVSAEIMGQIRMASYQGHLAMTTWSNLDRPYVFSRNGAFVQQKKTLQTLAGYFPYPNGTEPTGPLPRVEINSGRPIFQITE